MSIVQIFNKPIFGDLTVLSDDSGSPWFVSKQVGEMLEIVNVRDSVKRHVDERDKMSLKGFFEVNSTSSSPTLELNQRLTLINEAGLYDFILRTDAAKAKPFQKWITHDVIPEIRKTGSYHLQKPPTQAQALLQTAQLLNQMDETQQVHSRRLDCIEDKVDQLSNQNQLFLPSPDKELVSRIATKLGMSTQKANELCAVYELDVCKVRVGQYHAVAPMVNIESFKSSLAQEMRNAELSDNRKWFTSPNLGRFAAKGSLLKQYLEKVKGEDSE